MIQFIGAAALIYMAGAGANAALSALDRLRTPAPAEPIHAPAATASES